MITVLNTAQIQALYHRTRGTCTACDKSGIKIVDQQIENCVCVWDYSNQRRWLEAGIQKRYWDNQLPDEFDDQFRTENPLALQHLTDLVADVDNFVSNGDCLYLSGPNGTAKTAIAFWMLKAALAVVHPNENVIDYKYTAGFVTMAEISSLLIQAAYEDDKRLLLDNLEACDLIVIDEFEKEYKVGDKSNFFGVKFGDFFNKLYGEKKSLVLASNMSIQDIEAIGVIHTTDVLDRIAQFRYSIQLRGGSFRRRSKLETP